MGLVRALQPWEILLTYYNNQLRKYIAPLLRLARGGILHPPSDVYIRSFLCPISYFNKTLLHKSSWVIKPDPWSQNYILFFRDHEFDVVHRKLSSLCTITRGFQPLLMLCFPLCPESSSLFTLLIHSRPFGGFVLFCFQNKYLELKYMMHEKSTPNIVFNGERLRTFPLRSGRRQGHALFITVQQRTETANQSN